MSLSSCVWRVEPRWNMELPQSNVLILEKGAEELGELKALLVEMQCSVAIAHSEDQAIIHTDQRSPFLVILAGDFQSWSRNLLTQLRQRNTQDRMTIVALTDWHAPSWLHQEECPDLDGFLVKPISGEILRSLIQSAWARQFCVN